MATENKLRLLNLAVGALSDGEVYVEIGCYKGASLIGASAGNPAAKIYACDNFSQFRATADELRATLARRTAPGQVSFHDMEFRDFLRLRPWHPASIGVYFYDGGHSFADQYEALALVLGSLANDALVIIDDTNKRNVRAANRLFARCVPGFELVLDLRTARNHSPAWWNGIQLYRFRRSGPPLPLDGPAYRRRRFLWDDVLLRGRHLYRAGRGALKQRLKARARPRAR